MDSCCPGAGYTTLTFRFGFQIGSEDERDPVGAAKRAEELGFDVVLVGDHVGPGPSPMVTLAAVAEATTRIRIGTLVLNNDMRNPVHLAWEAATIDRLSHGRLELGLGAGHTPHEYSASGVPFDPPARRKQRLAESIEIVRQLVDGCTVNFHGEHYRIDGATINRSHQEHLPILVGGNGSALLAHAGAHGDIIGLQGLGRTHPDGHSHSVNWDPDHLTAQIEQVRAGAGTRFRDIELNALVQIVDITGDRTAGLASICDRIARLSSQQAAETPYLLVGTVDEIVEHIRRCRDRWGISYFVVRALNSFEPVLRAMRPST